MAGRDAKEVREASRKLAVGAAVLVAIFPSTLFLRPPNKELVLALFYLIAARVLQKSPGGLLGLQGTALSGAGGTTPASIVKEHLAWNLSIFCDSPQPPQQPFCGESTHSPELPN